MKRVLILVAFLALTTLVLIGCNGDNGTISQLPTDSNVQTNLAAPDVNPGDNDPVPDDPNPASNTDTSGLCFANNFIGEKFHVLEYKNKVITASINPTNCRLLNDKLKGEIRRRGVHGLREFAGDVRGIHGNEITIYTASLPKSCFPKKGETLNLIWKKRRHA